MISSRLPTHVRVWHHKANQPVGSAFVLDERHVMTCAHVVAQSLDRVSTPIGAGAAPDGMIRLDMPLAPGRFFTARPVAELWRGRQAGTRPEDAAAVDDIAVLRLEPGECLPRGAVAVAATAKLAHNDAAFAYGADADIRDSAVIHGRFIEHVIQHRIKLEPERGGVRKGFSGAAAWNVTRGGIVGMIVENREDGSGLVIPVETLGEVWPGFRRGESADAAPRRRRRRPAAAPLRERLAQMLYQFDRIEQASDFETALVEGWDETARPLLCVIAGLARDEPRLCGDKCRRTALDRRFESLHIPSARVRPIPLPWPAERTFDAAQRFAGLRNMVGDQIGSRGDGAAMRAAYLSHGRPLVFFSEIHQAGFGPPQERLLAAWGAFWRDLGAGPVAMPLVHFLMIRLDEARFDHARADVAYAGFRKFQARVDAALGAGTARPLPLLGHFAISEIELWLEDLADEIALEPDDIGTLQAHARRTLKAVAFPRMADIGEWIEKLRI